MEKVKVFDNDIVSKEIDRLTKLWFCDIWPRSRYTEPERTIHKMRSRMINLIVGGEPVLTKAVRITSYNRTGAVQETVELTKVVFNVGDSMAVYPSRILKNMLATVSDGGAIFIEQVWCK